MNYKGLSAAEVEQSRRENGSNSLTQIPPDPLWKKILEGFKDPMIMILLVALVVQVVLFFMDQAEWYEPVGILIAIIIANGVASVSESKQEGQASALKAVAEACRTRNIPIRIGVNAGSLEKKLLEKYGHPCPEAMVESARSHAQMLEKYDFGDICLSLKTSSVPLTVASYRLAAETFDYPLHLGVTETGTEYNGTIQSAVGIGTLLCEGIGNTIRVSLTADPVKEVTAGIAILKAAGLRKGGVKFVSCPTCGRTEIDLISLATEVEKRVAGVNRDITVAVMGCVVNGPGEAREADYGIAGGVDRGLIFKKGEVIGTYPYDRLLDVLINMIKNDNET